MGETRFAPPSGFGQGWPPGSVWRGMRDRVPFRSREPPLNEIKSCDPVMKLLPLLFGLSLVSNAALLVAIRERSHDPSGKVAGGADGRGSGTMQPVLSLKPGGPATGEGAAIADSVRGDDLTRLRDELRAAGLDEESVRLIVSVRLWKRYEARMKALQPAPDPDRPWWKNDDEYRGQTREQREQARLLRDEQRAELEALLGKDPNAAGANSWLARQYGFLPEEKREELQRLEQDYNDLASETRREARGFMLPSDQEKLRFIEEEKRRDLATFLSPEEYAAYEMRQSRTAQNLRRRMTQMDATEAEFRTIFEIQKDFDERFTEADRFGGGARTQEELKARAEAEKAVKAQIRDALGADRYAAYVRAQDNDYQQLRNATQRFQLPADTPDRIYALRDEVPRRATRIADDSSLSADQKREALKKLAAETRDSVRATLGSEVAQVYFANNGMSWVNHLENGTIVSFNEDGGQSQRRIEQAKKPATKPR